MTKPLWTSIEAARATGGRATEDWVCAGLSIDSRSLQPGDLFVPLKDSRDGHDFIPQAYQSGAAATLSEREIQGCPALIVDDTLKAMEALGLAARRRSKAVRIAVTGSVGKTSVKEITAHIVSVSGRTHKSQKSYNNHWGVPLTLANMPKETDYGVFELGMNHAGELSALSAMVAPDIAIITKIAAAHLAHFDTVDDIAAAKAEIFDGLVIGGVAILNKDDPYYDVLAKAAQTQGAQIITFGADSAADFQMNEIAVTASRTTAQLRHKGTAYKLSLPVSGEHWIANAACAIAAAYMAGIPVKTSIAALKTLPRLAGRGERFSAVLEGKKITIIDESYNANPESMRASIASLAAAKGRKIAVLGDMFELGRNELDLHAELSNPLIAADVARVIVTGECMRALRGALPRNMRGAWARDWDFALSALMDDIKEGDTVLIKGSNATGLGQLVAKIKRNNEDPANAI